jgi:adenylate kinase
VAANVLNLIMLGPPGAGKGTQADRLAAARGLPKISTGDTLRDAVKAGTALGVRAKAIMDRGELVDDEVMIGIVRDRLERPDVARGFILDGFPRTVAQARALDGILAGRPPLVVVDIEVADAELLRRVLSRLVCTNCGTTANPGDGNGTAPGSTAQACRRCGGQLVQRSDDNETTVRERLRVYGRDTKPLLDYYRARPTFRSIDGAQSAERVAAALEQAIDALAALATLGTLGTTTGEGAGAGR